MLNVNALVICGGLYVNSSLCYIYAHPGTGECILESDILGNVVLGEITVMNPTPFEDEVVINKMCNTFNCDGAIMCADYLITLKDEMASYRSYVNLEDVVKKIEFDTDTVYEGDAASYDEDEE